LAKTVGQFAKEARGFSQTLEKVERESVRASALLVTTAVRRNIVAVSGGDFRLSGMGRRGARVGARFDEKVTGGKASALVRATGPLQIVEGDTKPHSIGPKKRGPRGRRRALRIPGIGFRNVVKHPGTRGKHPFERGVNESLPKVPAIVQRTVSQAMRKAFG
jgi:hypothetical protein